MEFVLTLVAARAPLTPAHLARATDFLAAHGVGWDADPVWLAPHKAADIFLAQRPDAAQIKLLRALLHNDAVDLFVTRAAGRRKKLMLADMDATMIAGETLDEMAAHAGIGERISAITAQAMRGELDFAQALAARVGMLAGLDTAILEKTRNGVVFNSGGKTLVQTMVAAGAKCVLVSGGFGYFTGFVADALGFHHHHGNELMIAEGKLTGKVGMPILDKDAKKFFLGDYAARQDIALDTTMAIGDGANDLPMLTAAGLGVGYHPKPLLLESLDNCIVHGDLSAALYAQGYRADEFR